MTTHRNRWLWCATSAAVVCFTAAGVCDAAEKRILWSVPTRGSKDAFAGLTVAEDVLLGVRGGALYAFEPETGRRLWRYPRKGADRTIWGSFVRCVVGNGTIATSLRTNITRTRSPYEGFLVIDLKTGELKDTVIHRKRFGFPDPPFEEFWGMRTPIQPPLAAIRAYDKANTRAQIMVVNVETWQEVCRFILDGTRVGTQLNARGSFVHGGYRRTGEPFRRAFSVDIENGKLYTYPMRCSIHTDGGAFVLPDDTLWLNNGRLSPKFAYLGQWRQSEWPRIYRNGVYERGLLGFSRLDLRDGRPLWRIPLGKRISVYALGSAECGGTVVFMENLFACAADARTGKMKLAVRTWRPGEPDPMKGKRFMPHEVMRSMLTATDGKRLFFSTPWGLHACRISPLDGEPNPADPADPAYTLARCRAALGKADYRQALRELEGIGFQVRVKPSARQDAAELLSQLSRSPAPMQYPDLWNGLLLSDGWVAGELFLPVYERAAAKDKSAALALVMVGTPRALKSAAGTGGILGAEAHEMLTGTEPAGTLLAGKEARLAAAYPLTDEQLGIAKSAPSRFGGLGRSSWYLSGRQWLMWAENVELRRDYTNYPAAARIQAEIEKRGVGDVEDIEIRRPKQQQF